MAIPRAKKHDVVLPARPTTRTGVTGVVGSTVSAASGGRSQAITGGKIVGEDDALLEVAANQWGDYDAGFDSSAHARGGMAQSASVSQVATLTREMKALETRYFRTREQLEKITDRNDQLRLEMTKTRAQSAKMERDNAKLRHLVDRIQSEKKIVEQQAISNRDYAQKIEHKFFMGAPKAQTQTLVQSNLELTALVKALERELVQRADDVSTAQRDLIASQDKVGILKRALETRFEELQLNGSLHTGILFELSRLQDQNASMALQLGEERKASKALEVKLEVARGKQVELEEHLVVRETWLGSLENELAELSEKLATSENDKQTFAFEKATLLKFIQEQAEVKFQLEAELKRVHDAKMIELETFHGKLQTAMDEKQKLQDTVNELLVKVEKAQLENHSLDKSWKQEQQTTEELRTRQHEMFLDIQRLQDELRHKDEDFRAGKQVCQQLQTTIESQQQDAQTQQTRIDELEAIQTALEQEIVQRKDEEAALRTAMENALRDLEVLSRQRNEAARAMNEAVTISASSLDEQQALEMKVETQRKQLEQLKHSKNLLQNAMLEQLSALRKQLQIERLQRIETEAKLKQHHGVEPSRQILSQRESEASELMASAPAHVSPVTPTPSFDSAASEELHPLPPPEISLPSPLPPQMTMLRKQLPPRRSVSSSSSSDSEQDDQEDRAMSPVGRKLTSDALFTSNDRTPERTPRAPSIPSPSESLSLLELAGDL